LASIDTVLSRAGTWFLRSGIQETNGGVARYYCSDPGGEGAVSTGANRPISTGANRAISTEITGYAASAFTFLYAQTRDSAHLDAAVRCARYLCDEAWDTASNTFPFEPGSNLAYFFDIGIIARGLLAVWRATGEERYRERAREGALSLGFDFLGENVFYPVISLPEKQPLPEEPKWSRKPGCYQLKSALIWRELEDPHAARMFDVALAMALATHESFLKDEPNREKLMDRLHAYCYFLEALLQAIEHEEARRALAWGIERTGALLREIGPEFERSDVNAQLLRVRLFSHHTGVVSLNTASAEEEAARTAEFQEMKCSNERVAGGFWFGRKGSAMLPFSNPVSTAFCAQALALWDDHTKGCWNASAKQLI
jgi:hypothetical protein